ncbi:PapB/FocB family fimbrial expression transcriptional regulator [Pseudoalteromonas sp. BZB3]|uniref:PapB/FocB family fimbrial expression transcriptional regulator n=1 Tax=Pseudoalteromonas sp. BZB3 TaxID=3136670 RepID=UPI0032C40168
MKYLFKGMQTQERFELLLSLTRIQSESLINALNDYLVRGMDKKAAALANGVEMPNFSAALKKLEEKAQIIEKIKELDAFQ